MSQIVNKWKKRFSGCMHKSNSSYNQSEMKNPILCNDEFGFLDECSPEPEKSDKLPIYNEYDSLNHPKLDKLNTLKESTILKDATNSKKPKGLKRCFKKSNSVSKTFDENHNIIEVENYSELYGEKKHHYLNDAFRKNPEDDYCEIKDDYGFFASDLQSLIDLKPNQIDSEPPVKKLAISENKKLNKKDEKENQNDSKTNIGKNLTDLRIPESFSSAEEGFHFYLNLLNDKIVTCIQTDRTLNEVNRKKRLGIAKAHLLYSRNYYEMRVASSAQLKLKLANFHPCLLVLACLFESEAVRIEESHNCVCDTYMYLFATRVKYCAWKSKLFIFLKKPKRSSFDRLNLIEDLMSCHKLIQEKSV